MDKILVIGFGTMGMGIAYLFLKNGYNVDIWDSISFSEKQTRFKAMLGKDLEKKNISDEEYDKCLKNISFLEHLKIDESCKLVIEAISEAYEAKLELIENVNAILPEKTIFVSNTSSLSINILSEKVSAKQKFLGMHFFNPAYKMKLVELIPTALTTEAVIDECKRLLIGLSKEVVFVKDSPGFIVNRLLINNINEAALLLENNISTVEEIDKAMKLGAGHPMGPFELADFIGIDICLNILENFKNSIGNSYKISSIFYDMVNEKKLGKKTKIGFYKY